MNNTFDPDNYDMKAELDRVVPKWTEPFSAGGTLYPWQEELLADPEKLVAKRENWREYTQGHLDRVKESMALQQRLETESNYRFPPVTEENWRRLTYLGGAIEVPDLPCLLLGVDPTASTPGGFYRDSNPIIFEKDCPYDPAIYWNQCGGYACTHPQLHGIVLPLNDKAFRFATKLQKKWLDSLITPPPRLEQLITYAQDLTELELTCNWHYETFQEGWYPVDVKHLSKLADVDLGPSEEDLRAWLKTISDPGTYEAFGKFQMPAYHDWQLVICGENCD